MYMVRMCEFIALAYPLLTGMTYRLRLICENLMLEFPDHFIHPAIHNTRSPFVCFSSFNAYYLTSKFAVSHPKYEGTLFIVKPTISIRISASHRECS